MEQIQAIELVIC